MKFAIALGRLAFAVMCGCSVSITRGIVACYLWNSFVAHYYVVALIKPVQAIGIVLLISWIFAEAFTGPATNREESDTIESMLSITMSGMAQAVLVALIAYIILSVT